MKHFGASYRKSDRIITRNEPQYFDSYIAYDYERNIVHELDIPVINLLDYLTEKSLCFQCIKYYLKNTASNFSAEELITKRLIEPIISPCEKKLPIFSTTPNWIQKDSKNKINVAMLSSPTDVHLVLTKRCNLSCVHCNVSSKSLQGEEIISVATWKKILDELERMRVFRVIVTGGEPFVVKNFHDFFNYFGNRRFMKAILTNGTNFTENDVIFMKEKNIFPTLSIDGANASIHDQFRRTEGSFNMLLNALKLLNIHSVSFNLCCVVHKRNINQLEEIVKIANHYGAKQLIFQELKPIGRGKYAKEWYTDDSDKRHLLSCMEMCSKIYPKTKILNLKSDNLHQLGPNSENIPCFNTDYGATSCQAGTYGLVIDHDGIVYPCILAMQLKIHPIGSVLEHSLDEIWQSENWRFFREKIYKGCRINAIYQNKEKLTTLKNYI